MLQQAPNPTEVPAIVDRLKTILAEDLDIHVSKSEIRDDVSLMEDGLALDSVVLIELITHIETQFGFQLGDENLRTELFDNLTTLAEFIAAQRARQN
jgi:acyl carrier protein